MQNLWYYYLRRQTQLFLLLQLFGEEKHALDKIYNESFPQCSCVVLGKQMDFLKTVILKHQEKNAHALFCSKLIPKKENTFLKQTIQ